MRLVNPARSETLNPYRQAASLAWRRLRWDLDPVSWASRRRLRAWRDRHAGERTVIVCNGPSLLRSDLGLLEGVFTFGLNKINLLFERSAFRPSCIVSINPHVIEQNAEFLNETSIPLFLDSVGRPWVQHRPGAVFLHSSHMEGFARDCSVSVMQSGTVTYVAMQLAYHMGFRRVALIGADHDFTRRGEPNSVAVAETTDRDHFDPRYFSVGMKWQLPDLEESERGYVRAREVFEQAGGSIVNATAGGKLEVFERVDLADFVG